MLVDTRTNPIPDNNMPKNIAKAMGLIMLSALLIAGCRKEEDATPYSPPPTNQAHPLQQVFAQHLAEAEQHFTINTDFGPAFVQGADGLMASFAQQAFRKADGTPATGAIDITLVEALSVGEMLWLNKQTVGLYNGQPKLLVSGGQFRLTATQNGEPLTLAPGGSYIIVPSATAPDPLMELFSGTLQADGSILWDPLGTTAIDTVGADSLGIDSVLTGGGFYYNFPNDSLGWINCDYFYGGGGPLTAMQVTCPTGYTAANTMVWLVFPEVNSLTGLYGTDNVFATGSGYELPIGLAITVVALAEVEGLYYSSFTDAVVTQDMNLPITMEPTTLEQFELEAGGL